MITLEAGQSAVSAPDYKVFVGGEYEPQDLVCVYTDDKELAVGQFSALYISTGVFE